MPPWASEPDLPLRLYAWPWGTLAQHLTPETKRLSRGPRSILPLEIPFGEDEEALVKAFRLFLRRQGLIPRQGSRRRAGRKIAWQTWFNDLTMYRLSSCGYTRKEIIGLLKQSFSAAGVLKGQRGWVKTNPSAPNLSRSKRLIKDRIYSRYRELVLRADHWEKQRRVDKYKAGWPGRKWQDFFLKQGFPEVRGYKQFPPIVDK